MFQENKSEKLSVEIEQRQKNYKEKISESRKLDADFEALMNLLDKDLKKELEEPLTNEEKETILNAINRINKKDKEFLQEARAELKVLNEKLPRLKFLKNISLN